MSGRTVVVTGASSGIGLTVAMALAAGGDRVVAAVRDLAFAEAVVRTADPRLHVVQVDVTDDESVRCGFAAIERAYGPVDILVCSAGVGCHGTLEELTDDDLRETMEVDFYGVVRATRAVLPGMRARGRGRIVAVTSLGGVLGQPFTDGYCAAKFAVEGLFESLHPVAARFGVEVCLVEPGAVATEFRDKGRRAALPVYDALRARHEAVLAAAEPSQQSVADAAAAVVETATVASPPLRTQTSRQATKLVAVKLADPSGARIAALTARWLDDPA